MVMTHKKTEAQKKVKIHVKEDDSRYKNYTQAQAIEANRKLKEDQLSVERFEAELKQKRNSDADTHYPTDQDDAPDDSKAGTEATREVERKAERKAVAEEIKALEAKLAKEAGPGSKMRKEALQAEIDELMKRV